MNNCGWCIKCPYLKFTVVWDFFQDYEICPGCEGSFLEHLNTSVFLQDEESESSGQYPGKKEEERRNSSFLWAPRSILTGSAVVCVMSIFFTEINVTCRNTKIWILISIFYSFYYTLIPLTWNISCDVGDF